MNLVQATTIPGMKGCYVRAHIDTKQCRGGDTLFEPEHKMLEPLGVSAHESLVSVDQNGLTLIPVHNYQGVCVRLDEGIKLGAVRRCNVPEQVEIEQAIANNVSAVTCAQVGVVCEERYHELLKDLDLPESKLKQNEMEKLKELLKESTDIFALDDSELGCTNIVRHTIDTDSHVPIKKQPYRTPIVQRDTIKQMVEEM